MVNKGDRKPTSFDHHTLAMKLRIDMTKFLMQNFGTSREYKDIRLFENRCKMSEEDKNIINEIIDKYGHRITFETNYPYWVLDHARIHLLDLLDKLMICITQLDSIYPTSMYLYNLKLDYIQKAIGYCECIIEYFEFTVITFNPANADLSAYDVYLDMLKELISRLRNLRKGNNKHYAQALQFDLQTRNLVYDNVSNGISVYNTDGSVKSLSEFKKETNNLQKQLCKIRKEEAIKSQISEYAKKYNLKPVTYNNGVPVYPAVIFKTETN